jgi:dTDP-6-deoxy-L-talose 4-dehydrogenase (NAD+)
MNIKRVLISGASGFIGNAIIRKFISNKSEVLILSRKKLDHNNYTNIKSLVVDLKNFHKSKQELINFNPDVCIHLAWDNIPNFNLNNCLENLNNSINFLSFIINETNCKKIISAGSCFEYGKTLGICNENDTININNYFTWAKNSLRIWLDIESKKKKVDSIWYRIFYAYGEGQRKESLLPTILSNIKLNDVPDIKSPYSSNDFIHVNDVANAFFIASTSNIKAGIYNISSGKTYKVIDIIKIVENYFNQSDKIVNILKDKYMNNSQPTVNFFGSNQKIKNAIKWDPEITLEKYIQQKIDCY